MGRGHAVHERQAILSTTVVPYILYGAKERADPQKGVAVITWSYSATYSTIAAGDEDGPDKNSNTVDQNCKQSDN